MQTRDAERILRDERASRGYSSCFVNPNAICPVCKATVFYYQNDRGSRVFFDDLGPPWPKHGCTDNPRLSVTVTALRPQARVRGMRLELAEAASFLGLYDGGRYHRSGYAIDWQMIEITSVERKGFQLFLIGHLIEMADTPIVYFSITCPGDIIVEGDVVSSSYAGLSAVHPTKLEPRLYKVTWFEDERFLRTVTTGEHVLRPLREEGAFIGAGPERSTPASVLIRRSKTRRARPKTASPAAKKERKAKARKVPPRAKRRNIEPLLGAETNSEPKPKSAKQLKREEMISKIVVEYRREKRLRPPEDTK